MGRLLRADSGRHAVAMLDEDGYTRCDVCRRRYEPDEPSADWLDILVERDAGYSDADFCSQEHAAQWFARPLPQLTPIRILDRTMRDRLIDACIGLAFVGVGALAVIGVWTVIRWIWL